MTPSPSPSPLQAPSPCQIDESQLPKGQCRYILTQPAEIKGNRCACVNFSLNRSMRSVTCDCGHLACFHVKSDALLVDKHELELLKHRLLVLEGQLDREKQGGFGGVVTRVGNAEELVERTREEVAQENKEIYRNINRVWYYLDQRARDVRTLQENIVSHAKRMGDVDIRLQSLADRQLELFDADLALEERVEKLEDLEDQLYAPHSRPRRKSTSDFTLPVDPFPPAPPSRCRRSSTGRVVVDNTLYPDVDQNPPPASALSLLPPALPTSSSSSWTVHISLLPDKSQPFPFEKDTNAYKRCLSRGLQQMIGIKGPDAESFVAAVSDAFGALLKGRPWMPLQAKLCDVERLQGLPMLRPLDVKLGGYTYDAEFLRRHCAVCDTSGKIESLYIALQHDTLSWDFLRRSPTHIQGLESSWTFDRFLDSNDFFEDNPSTGRDCTPAGEIASAALPLKRAAADVSRTTNFSSPGGGADSDGPRKKMQRTAAPCIAGLVEVSRRVEKV